MNRRTAIVTTAGAILAIVTGVFTIDDRYYKTVEAAEYRQRADIDRESGDVELRIKIIELELQSVSDPRKERLLERQLEQLMERQNKLIELQQGR